MRTKHNVQKDAILKVQQNENKKKFKECVQEFISIQNYKNVLQELIFHPTFMLKN